MSSNKNSHEHHIQIPVVYRNEKYLSAIEMAFYRMLFVEETPIEHEEIEALKKGGKTTRIYLSSDADTHFTKLRERHSTNKRDTFLFALKHIEANKHLYSI